MSEEVKRYCMRAFGSIVQPIEVPYSGTWVPSADHDRIVSALIAGREAAERENESLRSKARASEQAALELRAEVERLQRELGTAHADASHYASMAEDLRAEREQLKPLLKEAGEELKEMKESVGYRAHTIGVIQRIDAALDEYDRAVIEAGTEPSVK